MADQAQEWTSPTHALGYLARANSIPHREEGEAALLEHLPASPARVLDIGTGDGRLLALVRSVHPGTSGVAIDFSPAMLTAARKRFGENRRRRGGRPRHQRDAPRPGRVRRHCLQLRHPPLPGRAQALLYDEVFAALSPGGVFLNLEHVSSPSARLHDAFLTAIGYSRDNEDRSNILLDVETQLGWLRALGFGDADCHWKWREMALLGGVRPTAA